MKKITSYEDLITYKALLKVAIKSKEEEIRNHPLAKLSQTFSSKESAKETVLSSVQKLKLKDIINSPIGSVISTYLLTNKVIRKYFVAFTIAKQTIPYALDKLKEILEQAKEEKSNQT